MAAMILAGLGERRREMAILRAVGASPRAIAALLVGEAALICLAGAVLGLALAYAGLGLARPFVEAAYGLALPLRPPTWGEAGILAAIVGAGALVGLAPAARAYRLSLADGMTVRT
jgi:putative ABC transport system permease protein